MDYGVQEESVMSQGPCEQGYEGHIEDIGLSPKANEVELKGVQQERNINNSHPHGIKI